MTFFANRREWSASVMIMAYIWIFLCVLMVMYPLVVRIVSIMGLSKHPLFLAYSLFITGVYRPILMLAEVNLVCYTVYKISYEKSHRTNTFEDLTDGFGRLTNAVGKDQYLSSSHGNLTIKSSHNTNLESNFSRAIKSTTKSVQYYEADKTERETFTPELLLRSQNSMGMDKFTKFLVGTWNSEVNQ